MRTIRVLFGCLVVGMIAVQTGPSRAEQRQWPNPLDLPPNGVQIVAAPDGRIRLQFYDPTNKFQQVTDAASIELVNSPCRYRAFVPTATSIQQVVEFWSGVSAPATRHVKSS